MTELMEQLDRAQWVRYDQDYEVAMAWFGGHGVHYYNMRGQEIALQNVGSFAENEAPENVVKQTMEEMLRNHNYEDFG